ncbi:MAG: hypothetical protein RMN24_10190 [Anaerolineae bacterium]|nr:hypothetical protein [Caldilineales bacterium]MDW8269523.1 hypothetical protein [Anaerolineae bacterium]
MNVHPFLSAPGLKPNDVLYILTHGHAVMRSDGEYITLREADMSAEDRRNRHLRRLIGIELILSPAGHVLAVRKERMKSPLPRPQPRRRALTPVPVF